nr:uncharacterized protein CTRU02_15891 [Colletotrichum truncatum]XP_036577336.1 uncharacterized protein CTRU02_12805 [Colletotrichum truncatum]XP_036586516.1 uncharacterized protein CTRU02_03901 [Colletotrichum truncatum]KAF6780537.1 hypothetical protein CTRU02_15891 [Colletotrichum truncatum]KAF6784276.1 hypothetical protein CTRU02_12805 [Colletotrichum truncatum]KAF6796923.1 hypothetical protein CTRU02_03901 [Colletotrichum truncatum]
MVSALKLISTIAVLAATAAAQDKKCYCARQGEGSLESRVDVGMTTEACHDQGYMRGNACIVRADKTREDDFMRDCLEIRGLQSTVCKW